MNFVERVRFHGLVSSLGVTAKAKTNKPMKTNNNNTIINTLLSVSWSRARFLVVAVLMVACSPIQAATYSLPVREIPVDTLNDLAMASYDSQGKVIYYNPDIARRAGPEVTAFIRAHEYGHLNLGHLERSMFVSDPYHHVMLQQEAEIEADKYATQYWMARAPGVVAAVIREFQYSAMANLGDGTHLPTPERAALIKQWRDEILRGRGSNEGRPTPVQQTCPACRGERHIAVQSPCPSCGGGRTLVCGACLGSGVVRNSFGQLFACPGCRGSGILRCALCGGSGGVAHEVQCPRCHGTGAVALNRGDQD
jgi:hypothetical protein